MTNYATHRTVTTGSGNTDIDIYLTIINRTTIIDGAVTEADKSRSVGSTRNVTSDGEVLNLTQVTIFTTCDCTERSRTLILSITDVNKQRLAISVKYTHKRI